MHVERIHISGTRQAIDFTAFRRRLLAVPSVQSVDVDTAQWAVTIRMNPVLADIHRVKHLARHLQTGVPGSPDAHRNLPAGA